MELRFYGAVRTVTGSMHMLSANGKLVLLDCGLYQGKRKEAFERNRNLPFDPAKLDAVVLSHAHIDHSGNLPTLVRRGFRGPLYSTPATADLANIMLQDSARLQVRDVEYVNKERGRLGKRLFEPLYEPQDVERLIKQFSPVAYEKSREILPGISIEFHDAGHLLGSAFTMITVKENGATRRILFTGDIGRKGMPILRDPVISPGADTVITESTYGDRVHDTKERMQDRLRDLIKEAARRGSKLLIPAFSVGRTQQILYFLNELYHKAEVPGIPVYVDSPLSAHTTEVYERHPECYDEEVMLRLKANGSPFSFSKLKYTTEVEQSKALNNARGPMVIIAASGMCEGGRIVHHLKHGIDDARNIVLFVGYQAEHTLGRYVVDGQSPVRILGVDRPVRARIETAEALSGHADSNELMEYLSAVTTGATKVFVVHGEMEGSEALSAKLKSTGIPSVKVPEPGEAVTL